MSDACNRAAKKCINQATGIAVSFRETSMMRSHRMGRLRTISSSGIKNEESNMDNEPYDRQEATNSRNLIGSCPLPTFNKRYCVITCRSLHSHQPHSMHEKKSHSCRSHPMRWYPGFRIMRLSFGVLLSFWQVYRLQPSFSRQG